MIKIHKLSEWNNNCYVELLDYIESLAIAKTLSGFDTNYYISDRTIDVLVYTVTTPYGTGFAINLSDYSRTAIFRFFDIDYNTSGIKGNLKSEKFKWNLSRTGLDCFEYTFYLDKDDQIAVKQIMRLLKFFRKYI